jgi:phosphoglycerate dehydrogenase-like enzyme
MPHSDRPIVLQLLPMLHPVGDELLADWVELRTASRLDRDTIIREGQGALALIARSGTPTVGAEIYDGIPSLAVVSSTGSGADCFDIAAATERGIPVLHNPGLAPGAVAEYVIGAMVVLARQMPQADRFLRNGGDWSKRLSTEPADRRSGVPPRGRELADRTLGVVGFGHIGRDVARRAQAAFGMSVMAYDPQVSKHEINSAGARHASGLNDLLAEADVVSLHLPLLPTTRHLINADSFGRMKPDALLINAARGGVVDEAALHDALRSGRLAGAAIDVFDPEPPDPANPLFALDNVLVTPHLAGATHDALGRLSRGVAEGLLLALRGIRPPRMVADVWPPARLEVDRWPLHEPEVITGIR